jgi:hypothetical protein
VAILTLWLHLLGDAFNLVTARGGDGGWYHAAEGEHYARLSLLLLLGFTVCCLLPLSLLRSMDSLQPTSAVAMVRLALALALALTLALTLTLPLTLTHLRRRHVAHMHPMHIHAHAHAHASRTHAHHTHTTRTLHTHTARTPHARRTRAAHAHAPHTQVCIVYTVAVVVCSPALPVEVAAEAALSRRLSEEARGYPAAGGAQAFQLSSSTLLSLPTMAFCFSSQSLFPPALETLHQPATYHHLHTVVDSTMALTPRRTLNSATAWIQPGYTHGLQQGTHT